MEENIIAIIPARSGSKGLIGKNKKKLLGKPLIVWTIEQALKSKFIHKIIINTDDNEIINISRKYNVEIPFIRPSELSTDNSNIIDVILHTLNWYENKNEFFSIIVLLEPTSPLRAKKDIDNAIRNFIKNRSWADALVSLGKIQLEHPLYTKIIRNNYVIPYQKENKNKYQRQQLSSVFFPYGVIYLSKVKSLKKYKTFYQKRTIPYFIERWQNYEIDDEFDHCCTEAILKKVIKEELF